MGARHLTGGALPERRRLADLLAATSRQPRCGILALRDAGPSKGGRRCSCTATGYDAAPGAGRARIRAVAAALGAGALWHPRGRLRGGGRALIGRLAALIAGCAADTARYPEPTLLRHHADRLVPAAAGSSGENGDWIQHEIHLNRAAAASWPCPGRRRSRSIVDQRGPTRSVFVGTRDGQEVVDLLRA